MLSRPRRQRILRLPAPVADCHTYSCLPKKAGRGLARCSAAATPRSHVERYRDLNIELADASVAVIAARKRTTRLLTLGQRHFRTIKPLWGETFILLPADAW